MSQQRATNPEMRHVNWRSGSIELRDLPAAWPGQLERTRRVDLTSRELDHMVRSMGESTDASGRLAIARNWFAIAPIPHAVALNSLAISKNQTRCSPSSACQSPRSLLAVEVSRFLAGQSQWPLLAIAFSGNKSAIS